MTTTFVRWVYLTFALTAVACVGGSDDNAAPAYPTTTVESEGETIAQVGPVRFTTTEFAKRLSSQSPFMRQRFADMDKREKYIRNDVRFELLAQEGWRRGLHSDPQIVGELKKAIVQRMVKDESERLSKSIVITEAELRAGYVERKDEYNKEERVRLSHIVRYVEDEAGRKAAKKLLDDIRAEVLAAEKANKPGAFDAAARDHSQDEKTKRSGGNLQFLTQSELTDRYGEAVAKTVFEGLSVGDSVVADAENAVVLFKKTGQRRGVTKSLEQVKPQLRAKLLQEKRNAAFEAFVEGLEKANGIVLNTPAIEKIEIDMAAPTKEPAR